MMRSFLYRTRSAAQSALTLVSLLFVMPLVIHDNAAAAPTPDEKASVRSVLDGIVRVTTKVPTTARTAGTRGLNVRAAGWLSIRTGWF